MTLETLLILALAAWRVAHLLVNERGPLAIGEHLRTRAGVELVKTQHTLPGGQTYETAECQGQNEIARMLCCIYCTSFWTSLLAVWWYWIGAGPTLSFTEATIDWFAVAALCIVAEKVNRYV